MLKHEQVNPIIKKIKLARIFELKPVDKRPPKKLKFKLIPIKEKPFPEKVNDLTKQDYLFWAAKYDKEHPWWIEKEKELGDKIRSKKYLDMSLLKEVVHWKFYELEGRRKITLNRLSVHTEEEIIKITKEALYKKNDEKRIKKLRKINGIGISLSSTILSFLEPAKYGIYDIHVYRELYGKEPKNMFGNVRYYIQMLDDLRNMSRKFKLQVRTLEKALFKKNLDESRSLSSIP